MWKQFVKDYLTFTKKERTAVLVLLVLIFIVVLLPYLWPSNKMEKPDKAEMEKLQQQMAKLKKTDSSYNGLTEENNNPAPYYPDKKNYTKAKGELFYFDPNTLSAEGWKRLGLRDKTIHTIQNYLSKGGKFKKPEDIGKVYGLFKDDYERLLPYVKLENSNIVKKDYGETKQYAENNRLTYPTKKVAIINVIDINTADTSAFIALPGIGSKLAGRIVNFRDKLGGFYSVAQIGETYGLPDSTFQKIQSFLQCTNPTVHQLNINTADANTLKAHPYIRWNLANVIVQYRTQHGNFKSIDDLQQITIITEDVLKKIKPYLVVQ